MSRFITHNGGQTVDSTAPREPFDWRAFLYGVVLICACFAEWHALDFFFKP